MTSQDKPPMFGPSSVIDLAHYVPRAGKSAFMAELIIGNCTATLPMKFAFDVKDDGHSVVVWPTQFGTSFT